MPVSSQQISPTLVNFQLGSAFIFLLSKHLLELGKCQENMGNRHRKYRHDLLLAPMDAFYSWSSAMALTRHKNHLRLLFKMRIWYISPSELLFQHFWV